MIAPPMKSTAIGRLTVQATHRDWVLTQGVRRGAHGANEPRSIAKLAGCDGDGSREEGGKGLSDPLIQLGTHADASPEHDELQIEERLQCRHGEGYPARRRVEDRRRHFVSLLEEPENVAHRGGRGSTLATVSIHDGERAYLELECAAGRRDPRSRVAPDWQVRDFPRRATRSPKQLVINEQAEPCTC